MTANYGGLGKGLSEPVPPYRVAQVFGADLNQVDANNWNSIPTVTGSTGTFDLSTITPNHEVCVALVWILGSQPGVYKVRFRWYQESSGLLLYEYFSQWLAVFNYWYYVYSYIGYTTWEINSNGQYRLEITVDGVEQFTRVVYFTVTGAVTPPLPPPALPEAVNSIVSALNSISDFFYDVYVEVHTWVWPFRNADSIFYSISQTFSNLGSAFVTFNKWVVSITDQIAKAINLDNLELWFTEWKEKLLAVWNWVTSAWDKVTGIVDEWWGVISTTVLGWINTAVQGLSELKVAWNNFWTVTFPTLLSKVDLAAWWQGQLLGINNLIMSTLKSWFPFYDELVSFWGEIRKFFADPLDWVYNKLDEFFERFW